MNVLLLTQYFWPESFRINEMVGPLQSAGCKLTVLTGPPNYPDGVVLPGYSAVKPMRQEHECGFTIYRVPVVPRGRGTALRLILNYFSFVLSASLFGLWMLRRRQFDAIFVYAPSPILQAIPAILLKRFKRAVLVIWVQDLWPQSLEVTGFVKSKHALKVVEGVVRWIYRQSDLLMVQSRAFVTSVRGMAGATEVEYLPNPGESAFMEQQKGRQPELVLEPGFNVVFAGNLGTAQALNTLLAAAELLRSEKDIRFVLVGSGSRGAWLKQQIAQRCLDNVRLPGRYAPHAIPAILAQASVLLVSLARSPTMSQTVPTKIQAYLAAGRPIVASLDGEGAQVVIDAGAGIACPAEDAAALAEAVLKLKAMDPGELQQMGEAGRKFYCQYFDPKVLSRHLIVRLRELRTRAERSHTK